MTPKLKQCSPNSHPKSVKAEAQLRALKAQLANMSDEERAQLAARVLAQQAVLQAVQAAQVSTEVQQRPAAIAYTQAAVDRARTLAEETNERDALVQLSVLLYNLAGYYQQAGRHSEAAACFEEVVALDEQTGHEDLASDREALVADSEDSSVQDGGVEETGSEGQERLAQAAAHFASLSPEEQVALVARTPLQMVEVLFAAIRAGQVDEAARAGFARQLSDQLGPLTAEETLGAGRHDLVALLACVVAHLRREEVPPVPAGYVKQWAEWVG